MMQDALRQPTRWNVVGAGREIQEGGDICVPMAELKWTGMGEFNSDDHYIYYCGQEFLRRNVVVLIANERVQNAVLGRSLKN